MSGLIFFSGSKLINIYRVISIGFFRFVFCSCIQNQCEPIFIEKKNDANVMHTMVQLKQTNKQKAKIHFIEFFFPILFVYIALKIKLRNKTTTFFHINCYDCFQQ